MSAHRQSLEAWARQRWVSTRAELIARGLIVERPELKKLYRAGPVIHGSPIGPSVAQPWRRYVPCLRLDARARIEAEREQAWGFVTAFREMPHREYVAVVESKDVGRALRGLREERKNLS